MFEVVYCSRNGSTRKVAEAIGAGLGVTPKDVKTAGVVDPDAFIFLGTGVYGAMLPDEIIQFLKANRCSGRKIALFTTSMFGSVTAVREIEEQLEDAGAEAVLNFKCFGRCTDINKDHPTRLDLDKARWFARSAAITLGSVREEKTREMSLVY